MPLNAAPDLAMTRGGVPAAVPGIGPHRDAWFYIRNDASEDFSEYMFVSIERIKDTTVSGAVYSAKKPTADSIRNYAITLHKLPVGMIGRATIFGVDGGVTLKYKGAAPTVGGTIGTKNGQYEGEAGKKGCAVLGVNTDEEQCVVRPFEEEGGVLGDIFRYYANVYAGTQVGGVIRWNQDDLTVQGYANNTTIDPALHDNSKFVKKDILPQGLFQGYNTTGWTSACILGDDLYVASGTRFNRAGYASFPNTDNIMDDTVGIILKYNRGTDAFDALSFTDKALRYYLSTMPLWHMTAVDGSIYLFTPLGWQDDTPTIYKIGWYRLNEGSPSTFTKIGDVGAYPVDPGFFGACEWNGKLVVYGMFAAVGDFPVPYLCYYDPGTASWGSLGTFNGAVHECFVDDAGDLYALGAFTTIDGNPFNRVARYSEGGWQLIGGGVKDNTGGGNAGTCMGRIAQGKLVLLGQFNECGTDGLGNKLTFTINPATSKGNIVSLDLTTNQWELITNAVDQYDPLDCYTSIGNLLNSGIKFPDCGRTWEVDGRVVFAGGPYVHSHNNSDCTKYGLYYVDPIAKTWENLFPDGHTLIGSGEIGYVTSQAYGSRPRIRSIVKLSKLDPGDPQYWFIGGGIGFDSVNNGGIYAMDGVPGQLGLAYDAGVAPTACAFVRGRIYNSSGVAPNDAQVKGIWITAAHKLLYVSSTLAAYRYQGIGAAAKAVNGRLWDVYPNDDFPLAAELTDYIKTTEPRPAWSDYYFDTFATAWGNICWPIYDPDDGTNGKLLLAGVISTWNPLSVKPAVLITRPVIDPITLVISEWTCADAFSWAGLLQSMSYCKDGGVWYRHKRGGTLAAIPLQSYSGGTWSDIASNWASISAGDRAYFNNSRWIWSDSYGTIYGLSRLGTWSWNSASGYGVIRKLDTSDKITVISNLQVIADGYIYFLGQYIPVPSDIYWGQYLCRVPVSGGAAEKLLWLGHGDTFTEGANGMMPYVQPLGELMLITYTLQNRTLPTFVRDISGNVLLGGKAAGMFLYDPASGEPSALDGVPDGSGIMSFMIPRSYRPTHNRIQPDTIIDLR